MPSCLPTTSSPNPSAWKTRISGFQSSFRGEANGSAQPSIGIVIRDNGPGLTPEQKRHLFEPFFTTKPQGTGLGMAIAKRIIDAHEGVIVTGNDNGRGATISITLPRGNK